MATCSNCHETGHNRRTCPRLRQAAPPAPRTPAPLALAIQHAAPAVQTPPPDPGIDRDWRSRPAEEQPPPGYIRCACDALRTLSQPCGCGQRDRQTGAAARPCLECRQILKVPDPQPGELCPWTGLRDKKTAGMKTL